MIRHFIEASNTICGGINWGKFRLTRFDREEWTTKSELDGLPLLHSRGWTPEHLEVFDLQTGEGALFKPGGSASHDLRKHRIWVCPLFEPFITWLWKQDVRDITKLPRFVELECDGAMTGERRIGPVVEIIDAINLAKQHIAQCKHELLIGQAADEYDMLAKAEEALKLATNKTYEIAGPGLAATILHGPEIAKT